MKYFLLIYYFKYLLDTPSQEDHTYNQGESVTLSRDNVDNNIAADDKEKIIFVNSSDYSTPRTVFDNNESIICNVPETSDETNSLNELLKNAISVDVSTGKKTIELVDDSGQKQLFNILTNLNDVPDLTEPINSESLFEISC